MSKLKEFKDRANFITDKVENSYDVRSSYEDLVEDLLLELQQLEHQSYILKNNIGDDILSYYSKITEDPTIVWYKMTTQKIEGTYCIKNPDFAKLKELGLYSFSDCGYWIRTQAQIDYLSQFVNFDFEHYSYYITFD